MGRLAPFIEPQVQELSLFRDVRFKVDAFSSGSGDPQFQDRFTVGVPCCSHHVTWHVLFDAARPGDAPDVIFSAGDEGFQPLVPETDAFSFAAEEVGTSAQWAILRDWRPEDASRLLKLILALRAMYLKYQWALAETVEDPRVKFELSSLAHTPGTEVFVIHSGTWGHRKVEEVQVAVPVQPLDLSTLRPFQAFAFLAPDGPAGVTKAGPGPSRVTLQVKFPVGAGVAGDPNGLHPDVKVECPYPLDVALILHEFKQPAWTDTMCVIEYLHLVQEQLQSKVGEVAAALHARSSFIATFSGQLGMPRETDTVLFLRTTVHLSQGSFQFLLHVLLTPKFPKAQPALQLQSCQHFDPSGRPIFSQVLDSYPWSPRWDSSEMTRRILVYLADEALRFKAVCGS